MIRNIQIFCMCIIFNPCLAQKYQIMEKFNIINFNTNKILNQYNRVLSDGTIINQFQYSGGYVEKTFPQKGWYYTLKEFYLSGQLKTKGELFKKGDFKSGLWYEYDTLGKIIDEIDYDNPYKRKVDEIFKILKAHEINFTLDNLYNQITRNVIDSQATWIVEWKAFDNRREILYINDHTGEVTKRDYYFFKDDN
jgi:hypothetical protein